MWSGHAGSSPAYQTRSGMTPSAREARLERNARATSRSTEARSQEERPSRIRGWRPGQLWSPSERRRRSQPLRHGEELDIEYQRGVWRNGALTGGAVGELRRDLQPPYSANPHASDADIPSADDLPVAEEERIGGLTD